MYKSKGLEIIGNFNPGEIPEIASIKEDAMVMIDTIEAASKSVSICPRRKAIALTHIEEAVMMAIKGIYHL